MSDQAVLLALAEVLANGLADQPRVASNVCWALHALAEAAFEQAASNYDDYVRSGSGAWALSVKVLLSLCLVAFLNRRM